MQSVSIYTIPMCPYCSRALKLLRMKEAEITEIAVAFNPKKKQEMIERTGGARTFPQIFIGDIHIGGCDELFELERDGKLDPLLNGQL